MPTSPLPLYSALMSGRNWLDPVRIQRTLGIDVTPDVAKLYDAQTIRDHVRADCIEAERFALSVPSMDACSKMVADAADLKTRLPYPKLWVETAEPVPLDGSRHNLAVLASEEVFDVSDGRDAAAAFVFGRFRAADHPVVLGPIGIARVKGAERRSREFHPGRVADWTYTPIFEACGAAGANFGGAAVAAVSILLALLDCKNVDVVEREGPARNAGKGRNRVGLRYKTLIVRSSRHEIVGDFDPNENGRGALPLHTVRGHFKTYTSERPLLGRVAGRFFWPSHVRGDQQSGVVIKDYAITE